jgi:hypothetical protein
MFFVFHMVAHPDPDFCAPQPSRTIMGHPPISTPCHTTGRESDWVPFGMFEWDYFCLSYEPVRMIFARRNHRAPSWAIRRQSTHVTQRGVNRLGALWHGLMRLFLSSYEPSKTIFSNT